MSMLAFNIAQFFPSLNYWLLPLILAKAGFDPKVSNFFNNYLVSRKTKYLWNSFSSPFYNVNVGVSQGLALLPIFSALYISPVFYILENHLKNLKIPILIYYSYNIISFLLIRFGLVMEHSKTEVFHFFRLHGVFNPLSLDLTALGSSILLPKLHGNT